MWLVISEPEDRPALWAYEKLKQEGLDPLEQVTPEELSYTTKINYILNSEKSEFRFFLHDGRDIDSNNVQGVLNRLTFVHTKHFGYSPDTQYAIQEFNAFFLGWLSSLKAPVINFPIPSGFSGKWRHLAEWTWLANIAGLPTTNYSNNSKPSMINSQPSIDEGLTVIVAGGELFGPDVPDAILDGCAKLADSTKTKLLEVKTFTNRWKLDLQQRKPVSKSSIRR